MEFAYLNGMRFSLDSTSGRNVIRGYAAGELKINEAVFHEPIIVSSSAIVPGPPVGTAQELDIAHAAQLLALEPELVLLGTGARQSFPAAVFGAQFLRMGIGFEVMDTGAACRTFNVLVAEQRRVVALLLP
ncbi:MAG: Mth938-like domain-containing protein [Steroidobacteraceae bacterium]